MQYALVDNKRQEATKGAQGVCPVCGAKAIAKCGPRIMHHWAHASRCDCDPWWENETAWHRQWKALFPEDCREISHVAEDGEIHRADIKTPGGIYIEVQHSPMTDAERTSREMFYKNLVWIVDGSVFRQNFDILHILPDPASALAQDLIWTRAKRGYEGANNGMFYRVSSNQKYSPGITRLELQRAGGLFESMRTIRTEVEELYRGHHQYSWTKPRKTWLDAACPVYIDFGDDTLVKLETYDETGLPCIRRVAKEDFLRDAKTKSSASDIAQLAYF